MSSSSTSSSWINDTPLDDGISVTHCSTVLPLFSKDQGMFSWVRLISGLPRRAASLHTICKLHRGVADCFVETGSTKASLGTGTLQVAFQFPDAIISTLDVSAVLTQGLLGGPRASTAFCKLHSKYGSRVVVQTESTILPSITHTSSSLPLPTSSLESSKAVWPIDEKWTPHTTTAILAPFPSRMGTAMFIGLPVMTIFLGRTSEATPKTSSSSTLVIFIIMRIEVLLFMLTDMLRSLFSKYILPVSRSIAPLEDIGRSFELNWKTICSSSSISRRGPETTSMLLSDTLTPDISSETGASPSSSSSLSASHRLA